MKGQFFTLEMSSVPLFNFLFLCCQKNEREKVCPDAFGMFGQQEDDDDMLCKKRTLIQPISRIIWG